MEIPMVGNPNIDNLNYVPIDVDDANLLKGFDLDGEAPIANVAGDTTVYFRNLKSHLIHHIKEADYILGCVAWFTDKDIVDALCGTQGVAIVVQKEDFLRPDSIKKNSWPKFLRAQYERLPSLLQRQCFPGIVSALSYASDPELEPVRCVGNHNSSDNFTSPKMHHKFVVFAHLAEAFLWHWDDDLFDSEIVTPNLVVPYAVWTGSFNFTNNSTNSLENALYITDRLIVNAYYDEWSRIVALSEPLDWTSNWTTPQWRIGT
jgi:hypothetical protein